MNLAQNQFTVFPSDCLPPEGEYESRDALFKAINAWAAPRGYAFTTGKSTMEKTGRRTVIYSCDRSCRPPSATKERRRKTTSRGTGCEFSVLAKESLDKTKWTLRHRPDKRFSSHNHEPSQHPSAHPNHRKLSEEDLCRLISLSNAGVSPKGIRTYIRQNTASIATQQDIYNRIADARRSTCEGQSTINALANQLDREGFWNRMQLGQDDRVTAILFAHPESLAYLQAYPDTLILDCTYKTNKYGMPLLDMIGVDACQRSFCIAFAFLSGETEQDYFWALDRLKSLYEISNTRLPSLILTDRCLACLNAVSTCFPSATSLLCLWHANKAVLRHCQPTFTQRQDQEGLEAWNIFYNHWHLIMKSPTEEIFHSRVSDFEQKYLPTHIEEVGYIKTYWLDLYKEKLVKAWVNQHLHFDNVVTSRVEGVHSLLKSHLKRSTLDLFEAWKAIKQALLNQLAELRSNQAKQQIRTPIELSGPLYSVVRGWISHEALRKVEEQRKLLTKSNPPPSPHCSGSLSRSQGLPCVHKLEAILAHNQVLRLEDFHTHWHLDRRGTIPFLLEPRQQSDRGAIASILPRSSIRRELSGFEIVEAATAPRTPPLCSKCHILGHTRSSKQCPLRYAELRPHLALTSDQSQPEEALTTELGEASEHLPACPAIVPALVIQNHDIELPTQDSAQAIPQPATPAVRIVSRMPSPSSESIPSHSTRYDDPRVIYQRYVKARDNWYKAQPPGTYVNNQLYRKAMGLPLRYSKASYEWCQDYKQMGRKLVTSEGARDWTREEMMAYLDWDKSENDRIDAQIALESGDRLPNRRGMGELWSRAERDIEEQQALCSASKKTVDCIIVQP
ncbi:hypothetical protein PG987_000116 [Apiospora arundinis]